MIEEKDALFITSHFNAFPPDVQEESRGFLQRYADQQEAARLPLFPAYEAQKKAQQDARIATRNFFTKDDNGLTPEKAAKLREGLRGSIDPENDKAQAFLVHYLADRYGKPHYEASFQYPQLREDYARKEYPGEKLDDKALFGRIRDKFLLEDTIAEKALEGAYRGQAWPQTLSAGLKALQDSPGYNPAKGMEYMMRFAEVQGRQAERLAPYRDIIDSSVSDLQKRMGVRDGEDPGMLDIAQRLLTVPKKDRPLVMRAVATVGAPAEDTKWAVQKLGERVWRGTVPLFAGLTENKRTAILLAARKKLDDQSMKVLKSATVDDIVTEALGIAAPRQDVSGLINMVRDITGSGRVITEEEREKAKERVNDMIDLVTLMRDAEDMAQQDIDPANSDNITVQGLYGAAQSAPQFAAAITPFGWTLMTGQFANDNFHKIRREQPDMPLEKAHEIAVASAPFQTVVETVVDRLIWRMPLFSGLFRGPAASITTHLGRLPWLVPKAAAEYGEEYVQHHTPYLMQEVIGALQSDMPDAPWDQALKGWKDGQSEVISTVIWMTILGHGGGSIYEMGSLRYQAERPELLQAAGYSERASLGISKAAQSGDWRGVEDLMRAEWKAGRVETDGAKLEPQRTVAAERLKEESEMQLAAVQHLEASGFIPTVRPIGEGQWRMELNDEKEAALDFSSFEEAEAARGAVIEKAGIDLHESARAAISELLSRKAAVGRAYDVEFIPETSNLLKQREAGEISEAASQRRADISDEVGTTEEAKPGQAEDQAYDSASAAIALSAKSNDERLASMQVLGSNKTEFKNGVMRTRIRLYQGATSWTIVEEKVEGDAVVLMKTGQRDWMISSLRSYERVSGDKIFRTADDAELRDDDVREAWSHYGLSYLAGRSKRDQSLPDAWKAKGFRKVISDTLRSGMAGAMHGYAAFFNSVFRRTAKMDRARRDGKIDAEFEMEIARSLGLEQGVYDAGVMQEAEALRARLAEEGLELDPDNAPFSVITGRVERGRQELRAALSRGEAVAERYSTEMRPEFAQAVEEDAANGYPGMPGLTPAVGLSRAERIVEARFAQLISEDPEGAVAKYRELAREDFGSDRYLNADLALSLLPEYAANKEFRTVFHRATYAPVSYLTRLLVMPQILSETNIKERPLALFLAGGPASGKTTSAKKALNDALEVSAIIVDSNLATMARGNEFLNSALQRGFRPQVVFIYTPWEKVERFVLHRLGTQGRPISAETLSGNHFDAQQTFLRLSEAFQREADFVLITNEGAPEDIAEKPLEYLRERTYASKGENGSKATLAARFRDRVIREWGDGNLSTVEAIASGWSAVDQAGLRKLEEGSDRIQGEVRQGDASSEGAVGEPSFSVIVRRPITVPDALLATKQLGDLTSHPDYAAGKAGNTDAAFRVAEDIVTPEFLEEVRVAIGDDNPIVLPVLAVESAGVNKLPLAGAEAISQGLGLELSTDILQAVKANRSGAGGLDRIFKQVQFDGPVISGRNYLILDDTLTQGGTFAGLIAYIEAGGARVSSVVALTGKEYSAKLAPSNATLAELRAVHGDLEDTFKRAVGHGFDALTQSEARYLANFRPAHKIRTRILEERDEKLSRENEGAAEPEGTGYSVISSGPGGSSQEGLDGGRRDANLKRDELSEAVGPRMAPVDGRSEPSFSLGSEESGRPSEQLALRARESILRRHEDREADSRRNAQAAAVAAESLLGAGPSASFGQSKLEHRQREAIAQRRLLSSVAQPHDLQGEYLASEGEHLVHHDPDQSLARKATKEGRYGYVVDQHLSSSSRRLVLREALPSEYLWRLGLQNAVFGDAITLDGIASSSMGPSIQTSQPWVDGDSSVSPIVLAHVNQFMESQGFVRIPKGMLDSSNPNVLNWYRAKDQVWVADAKPPNFIRLSETTLVPIDLVVQIMPLELLQDTAQRNGVQWAEIEESGSTQSLGMSVVSGGLDARLSAMFDPFQRSPELRGRLGMEMQRRAMALRSDWEGAMAADRTRKDIEAERKTRQDELFHQKSGGITPDMADIQAHPVLSQIWGRMMSPAEGRKRRLANEYDDAPPLPRSFYRGTLSPDQLAQELADAGLIADGYPSTMWAQVSTAYTMVTKSAETIKKAQKEAREEARAWADEAIRKANSPLVDRARLLAALRTLDAITSALPPEIRAKVGGHVQIAKLSSDEKRLEEIESRTAKIDKLLEEHLRKDFTEQFERLLKRARVKGKPGEKAVGKIGVEGHRWFNLVETASAMDDASIEDRMAAIQSRLSGEITPEHIAALSDRGVTNEDEYRDALEEEEGILTSFGDFASKSAQEMDSALKVAKSIYMNGRLEWTQELERRRAVRADRRDNNVIPEVNGAPATDAEVALAEEAAVGLVGWVKRFLGDHNTLEQAVGSAAGLDSRTRAWVDEITTEADLKVKDAMITRNEALTSMWRTVFPGGTLARLRSIEELTQRHNFEGKRLSQMEGVHYSLMWKQQGLKTALETHGYGEEFQGQLDAWLTPEAKAVRAWLGDQYESQYSRINEVFKRRYGVDLPKVKFYSPAFFDVHGQDSKITIEDGVNQVPLGGLSSIRVRKKHAAKPRQIDAVQAWIHNAHNVEHWIGWSEPMAELRATFGHTAVRAAVKAGAGVHVMRSITERMDDLESQGARNAESQLSMAKFLRRQMKALADVALVGKMATLAKQLPAAYASAAEIGIGSYLKSAGRVIRGKSPVGYFEMLRSDTIQRRMTDYSPEWDLSRKGFEGSARGLEKVLRKVTGDRFDLRAVDLALEWGRQRPSRADAVFTALSAAAAFDHHYSEAKSLGMTEVQAVEDARRKTDATILHTAQPDSLLGRSHMENRLGTIGKGFFAFQSPNRQAFAMTYLAWQKGNHGVAASRFLLHWVITGAVIQTIGNLFRYATSDDDWDDTWEAKDYALAMGLGPMTGVLFFGQLLDALGTWAADGYQQRTPSPTAVVVDSAKAIEKLFTKDELELRDIGQTASTVGQALGGKASVLGVGWNLLRQIFGFTDAVTPGDQETVTKARR